MNNIPPHNINNLELEQIADQFLKDLDKANRLSEISVIHATYLGRKGILTGAYKHLLVLNIEERKQYGQALKVLSEFINKKLLQKKLILEDTILSTDSKSDKIDIYLPPIYTPLGALHPITLMMEDIKEFFLPLGFCVFENTNELETPFFNFDALHFPKDHPARSKTDTFYIHEQLLLRTHTSNTQIKIMKNLQPPIKALAPGRVYRRDSDRTHTPMFHQIEGFVVNTTVTWIDLINIMKSLLQHIFSKDTEIRYRPSYFPFTEPSLEVDIKDKLGNWLEILGCGMIHPAVLQHMNLCPNEYQGFAFGIGIERLTMLKYNINDMRALYNNDIRFLQQFSPLGL